MPPELMSYAVAEAMFILVRSQDLGAVLGPARKGAISGGAGRSQWDHLLELSRSQ